jgi:hypothetical protein
LRKEYYNIDPNDCINKYSNSKIKPENSNDSLIIKEKLMILDFFSKEVGRNISFGDTVFLEPNCNFGNSIAFLNKIIFYCEIIGCKTIILDKNVFWYIKNQIILKQYNISIKIDENIKNNNASLLYFNSMSIFYSFFQIKPEIRINLIRNEIIRNLIKFEADKDDLYIHIRSGDIFIYSHPFYSQPPLCFYKKILNNTKFKKVHLIAQDENNPIIEKIIKEYPNIIYNHNSLKQDISYLINAYNIVASISSFLISIVQLNYNLKILFDYNIYKLPEKILVYHYDLYQFTHNKFIIFRMEPSSDYNKTMYIWKNNKKQRKLMIKEKCINNFITLNASNNK